MMPQASVVGKSIKDLDTPALLVDLDLLDQNIATMKRVIIDEAGIQWRPHTKAIKTPAIAHKLLRAGAHGITCAKLSEAEVMASAGIRNILIANQVVGASKLARLAGLCHYADPIVAVDCEEHVKALDLAAKTAGTHVRVVVEVNIAMHRAGVEPGAPVVALAQQVASCGGLRLAGLMAWEGGRIAEIQDPESKRAHRGRCGKTHRERGPLPGRGVAGGDSQLRRHGDVLDHRRPSRRDGGPSGWRDLL